MNRRLIQLLTTTALGFSATLASPAAAQSSGAAVVFLPPADLTNAPALCGTQPSSPQSTFATAISADGTVVAGSSGVAGCLVLWRNGVPVLQPGTYAGQSNLGNAFDVTSLSGDGRVVVGHGASGASNGSLIDYSVEPTQYWTEAGGSRFMPVIEALTQAQFNDNLANLLPGYVGTGFSASGPVDRMAVGSAFVNGDGSFFAVNSAFVGSFGFSNGLGAFSYQFDGRVLRWSPTSGYQELPNFGTASSMAATGIDSSGNRIVGLAEIGPRNALFERERFAFLWDAANGMSRLPDLASSPTDPARMRSSQASGISRDGTTVIGFSRAADSIYHPVRWRGGAIEDLGFLPGRTPTTAEDFDPNIHIPLAASAGGAVIVGRVGTDCCNGETTTDRAWRWSATTGMQDLNLIAANAGLNLNGFILYEANGISDDSQFISGNAYNGTAGGAREFGFVLQLAQVTRTQLIIRLTLPGVTLASIVNQSFSTQVDGTLNGATVFTRTVGDTISSTAGTTALADARSALQATTGLRRVVISAPVLISNTTTVLGSTSNTVNVPSGTTTSIATINTFGPATVITGDLGTCATGVVGNTAPTGCSLPGTAVDVDPGILNSNIYATTAETVTPTTTPTVNQRIDARWQVAATAGNRFGTAHALVGPASFERGDRLVMQLLGQAGGIEGGSAAIARAASPMKQRMALGDSDSGFSMFGGYFNASTRIDADAALAIARAKGKADGFVLGVQKELGDVARIGIAVDHGKSDYSVRDATYPETLDLKQTQIGLYGGWNSGRFALSGAAAYSFGDVKTAIASPGGTSIGNRDISGWSLGAQGSYTLPVVKSASLTLVAGLRHSSADLKRFAEVGGLTPLIGLDGETHRTRLYAGLQGEARIALGSTTITPRLYGRYAHDSGDASGIADVVFASAPNAAPLQAIGAQIGRDVAELGGSIEAQIGGNVAVWGGYDGQFRSSAQSHTAKVGVTIAF